MKIVITGHEGIDIAAFGRKLCEQLGLNCHISDDYAGENQAVSSLAKLDWCVLVARDMIMLDPDSRRMLRDKSIILLLTDSEASVTDEVLRPFADIVLEIADKSDDVLVEQAIEMIGEELAIRFQSANTFGNIIRVTTFGKAMEPQLERCWTASNRGSRFQPMTYNGSLIAADRVEAP